MTDALTDALNNQEPQDQVAPTTDQAYLPGLVGEGKKFSNDEGLAKAYHHANLHIEEMKADLAELKGGKELLNEVLDEIRNSNEDASDVLPAQTQAPDAPQPQVDDVAKIVSDQFASRDKAAQVQANLTASNDKLAAVYGTPSQVKAAVIKAVGSDSTMKDVIDNLSKNSPDAMVKLITGMVPVDQVPASNTPGTNMQRGTAAPMSGELTWSQCRDIRKSDPRLYASTEFRTRMEGAVAKASAQNVDFFAT